MINMAAIGLYMLLTTASGNPAAIPAPEIVDTNTPVTSGLKEESIEEISRDVDVEAYVREYFSDIPIMAEVARCESHFTHFTESGKVLRGIKTPEDVGVMQINEYFHGEQAKAMNIDIHTLDGNLEYARYLYSKKGVRDWSASDKCWHKIAINR